MLLGWMGQQHFSGSIMATKGWRTGSTQMLARAIPGGLLGDLAMIVAMDGAAIRVMMGGLDEETA
jgi:hypothetical protein